MSRDLLETVGGTRTSNLDDVVGYLSSLALLGRALKYLAVTPLLPTVVALYYGESPVPFLVTSAVMVGLGAALEGLQSEPDLGHREAFLFVSLTWLVVPLVGTLPYLIAGQGTVAGSRSPPWACTTGSTSPEWHRTWTCTTPSPTR